MKNTYSTVITLLLCLLVFPTAFGLTLQEAKNEGLIGEQRDGYIGLVIPSVPADVRAMVQEVNAQRRQRYQQIAQQNNISVEQVAALAYEKAVAATRSGHYIQNSSGAWVQK